MFKGLSVAKNCPRPKSAPSCYVSYENYCYRNKIK